MRNGLNLNGFEYFHSMLASRMECVNPDVNVQLLVAY